jgi:hypothetical protein
MPHTSMHDCVDLHSSPALDLCPRHWHCSCQANTRPRFSCCRLACALYGTAAHAACNKPHTSTNPLPGRNTAPLHVKQTSAPARIVARANTGADIAVRHDSLRSSSNSDGVACCFVSFKCTSCSSRDVGRVRVSSTICQARSIHVEQCITSLPAVLPFFAASSSAAGILQVYFFPVLSAITIVRMPGSAGGSAASPARQHWLLMRRWIGLKCVTPGAAVGLTISIYSDDVLCLLLAVQKLYRGVCAPNTAL